MQQVIWPFIIRSSLLPGPLGRYETPFAPIFTDICLLFLIILWDFKNFKAKQIINPAGDDTVL